MKWALAPFLIACTAAFGASTWVDGYVRKDGAYVAPHYRTAPCNSRLNNYSTPGNFHPYTGEQGTVNPYAPPNVNSNSFNNPYAAPTAPDRRGGYR